MESEYHRILSCLKNHNLSCVALKPTALIPAEKIMYLSELMKQKNYQDIDLDILLNNSELDKIAEPFSKLSKKAVEFGTRILIDAEQSNLQPGVDLLALFLMRKFNLNSKAHIYNTYQLYLKDGPLRLRKHKQWIATQNVLFAAKIVRGAYLTYEQNVQENVHPNYKICSSKSEVDQNYNNVLRELILENMSSVVVATHNLDSLKLLKSSLNEQGLNRSNNIEYAFLMGFGEKIEGLTKGLRCLEYVPYGPSDVKIPYLIRRLEENANIFMNNK
jgi:proline dehydrogenase